MVHMRERQEGWREPVIMEAEIRVMLGELIEQGSRQMVSRSWDKQGDEFSPVPLKEHGPAIPLKSKSILDFSS